jgi:hypothetical protein
MAVTDWLHAERRAINMTPPAFGDAAVRQRMYRRGGLNTSQWVFLGQNSVDGGGFTDRIDDLDGAAAGLLEFDHHQPVATVDDNGAEILAQPVPVFFGPTHGMLFALGDPHRPGHVYWVKNSRTAACGVVRPSASPVTGCTTCTPIPSSLAR